MVITLQSDLDTTEKALQAARKSIANDPIASESLEVLDGLEHTYSRLMTKVNALYALLNVQDQYPELDGIGFNFVWVLLLAHNLKINIHKQAIGSFFEWDKLDQAVGGGQKPLDNRQGHVVSYQTFPLTCFQVQNFTNRLEKQLQNVNQLWWLPSINSIHIVNALQNSMTLRALSPFPTLFRPNSQSCMRTSPSWKTFGLPRLQELYHFGSLTKTFAVGSMACWRVTAAWKSTVTWVSKQTTSAIGMVMSWPRLNSLYFVLKVSPLAQVSLPNLMFYRWKILAFSPAMSWPHPWRSQSLDKPSGFGGMVWESHKRSCFHHNFPCVWNMPNIHHLGWTRGCRGLGHHPRRRHRPFRFWCGSTIWRSQCTSLRLSWRGESGPQWRRSKWCTGGTATVQPLHDPCLASTTGALPLAWTLLLIANVDQDLTIDPTTIYGRPSSVDNVLARRILPPQNGFPQVIFDIDTIKLLRSPTVWLDDVCINRCIPLLFASIRPDNWNTFAVFSTHDLLRFRYNATNKVLWQWMHYTSFWTKDIWILPIHCPGHWVLCIAQLSHSELLLFDSLGEQHPWRTDVEVRSSTCITFCCLIWIQ